MKGSAKASNRLEQCHLFRSLWSLQTSNFSSVPDTGQSAQLRMRKGQMFGEKMRKSQMFGEKFSNSNVSSMSAMDCR